MNFKQNNLLIFMGISAMLVLLTTQCQKSSPLDPSPSITDTTVTIKQGVYGYVRFWEGNFSPIVLKSTSSRGTVTRVEREIVFHTLTPPDSEEVVLLSCRYCDILVYQKILTSRVAKVRSNAKGFYQVELTPGQYSVYVNEDSLFLDRTDTYINKMEVTVKKDSIAYLPVDIAYKAFQ